jgi:hypothetical protein
VTPLRFRADRRGATSGAYGARVNSFNGNGPSGVSGHRSRSLIGTFGRVEIAVPRARLDTAEGKTAEWKSKGTWAPSGYFIKVIFYIVAASLGCGDDSAVRLGRAAADINNNAGAATRR